MSNRITFIYGNTGYEHFFDGRYTVFELMTRFSLNGVKLDFPCGGKKTCGKCKIKIKGGFEFVSQPDETEKGFLSERELKENVRYACMCEVFGDVAVELNPKEKIQIQTEGLKSKNITPDKFRRFAPQSRHSALDEVPDLIRDREIAGQARNDGDGEIYGAAVDIGTTTVAVYLYDMTNGNCIGIATEENPQRAYGADVITRINYTIENPGGLNNLKSLILSLVFRLIKDLCENNNINPADVYSVVLTGNTVMQHIAMGFPPKTIAFAPFTPVSLFGFEVTADEIGMTGINPNAVIYFPPAFASYVGGDIATGIIASDTDLSDNLRLFIDIGTNGEIGLIDRTARAEPLPYTYLFCATAAGPAFEGAHIKLGMPGVKGAINNIYIESGQIICETIGRIAPKGICGSGIIDAVAVMLELGVIDETGRVLESDEEDDMPEQHRSFAGNLCEIDGENAFVLDVEHNIYITQKDVREIQLAKAAVSAGIMTLLHYAGKSFADVGELILAGGFGAHINKKSACQIGLIPQELEDKIIIAGNTAGMGAAAVLLDYSAEERIKKVAEIANYIELSCDAFFMDEYVERMMF